MRVCACVCVYMYTSYVTPSVICSVKCLCLLTIGDTWECA